MSTVASLDFSGKRVLVTGGGRGIGKGIVEKFLELKATVVVLDKDEGRLNALKSEQPLIETLLVDLADWDATGAGVSSVLPIHHLVNNAATYGIQHILDVDSEHMDRLWAVNVKAPLNVAQVVARGMKEHGISDGTIVSMSSVTDERVMGDAVYSGVKAALVMLTKCMAVELAPHGIRVNGVRPALVDTELIRSLPQEHWDSAVKPVVEKMLFKGAIPASHVADAVVFLSSPLSQSVTGHVLTVDRGFLLH